MSPAERLTARLKGVWHQRFGTAQCPAHKDAHPSLSIRDGEHEILLKCHAGCSSRDIVDELRRRRLWPVEGFSEPSSEAGPDRKREAAIRIWREAGPIAGTIAENYLRNRGITNPLPVSLRYQGALLHRPTGLHLPGMVAAVQAPTREVVAVHRTYLTVSAKKAVVSTPKMALGCLDAGAVRLAKAEIELGLAEGVETALSAMQIFNVPCWATLGGERLHKIELPPDVARVVIFGDNGGPGRAAAMRAVETYTGQRRKVTLRFPPTEFGDWNDVLQARQGAAA